jgi:hypothetical protein
VGPGIHRIDPEEKPWGVLRLRVEIRADSGSIQAEVSTLKQATFAQLFSMQTFAS